MSKDGKCWAFGLTPERYLEVDLMCPICVETATESGKILMSVLSLNSDVLHLIFDLLDLHDLSCIARTCRTFNTIVIGNNFSLWRKFAPDYSKNHIHNWRTLITAHRIERSLYSNPHWRRIKLFSSNYGTIEMLHDVDRYTIFANHSRIKAFLFTGRYNDDTTFEWVDVDDSYNMSDVLAQLITYYGFAT